MSYNKTRNVDIISSSYDESYLVTKMPPIKNDVKKVKILKCPDEHSNQTFEDVINSFILENTNKIELIDIKYTDQSCLIIYKII
jgi:hypothetical protein